ncbi:unnamed protein product [Paramecium sonneborni]|uniref:Uncharacterized protein n=1 Tax=Paramecium sonneborni TaxID=65129 RepID=A0A8S1P644_9CILI|nr:unnamed protein product [Paramecium sonneborni]
MFCYKAKLLSSQKYNIFMLKDEIQLQHENKIEIIKLNSFEPRFKWAKCDTSEIGQFELLNNQQSRIYKIEPSMGMLLKEFLNGKVCFQGIDNQYRIAKIISKGNSGSIVNMRNLYNGELVTCKIYKQGNSEFIYVINPMLSRNFKMRSKLSNFQNIKIYQKLENITLKPITIILFMTSQREYHSIFAQRMPFQMINKLFKL